MPEPSTAVAVPAPGQVARQDFSGAELAVTAETAASAAAAQGQAIVQARYLMALRKPRDWDEVRVRVMREVERPGFADVAWYEKPIGGSSVEGLSIRFAEAAMRCMTNLLPEAPIIYDDARRRILRVTVTDLESNLTWSKDVIVEKTVERRSLRRGQVALQVRTNSANETTYLVEATEDQIATKEAALVSKTTRTLALRILPGDIQDAARKRILEIRGGVAAKDPEGERRKVVDAFAALNVLPPDLKRYLGHEIGTSSPAEIKALRGVYSAIASGEATWAEVLAEKLAEEPAPPPAKTGLDAVTERLEGKAPAATATTGAPAAPATAAAAAASAPATAPGCLHPGVPPSKVAALPAGRSIVCPDCGEDLRNPDAAPAERQPGEDDDEPGPTQAALPMGDARAAVEAVAKKAGDTTQAPAKPRRTVQE